MRITKIIILAVLTLILVGIGYCTSAKAEGAPEASPSAEPSQDPGIDPDIFEWPDWIDQTFAPVTPEPSSTPSPTLSPEQRDLLPGLDFDEIQEITPYDNDGYYDYFTCWASFLNGGDTSVWYFRSQTGQMIAVSNRDLRPFYPWIDNSPPFQYSQPALYPRSSSAAVALTSTNAYVDASRGDYNFSYFWVYEGEDDPDYSPLYLNYRLFFGIAMNKCYPHIYNAPSWFAEIGLTDAKLLNLPVSGVAVVELSNGVTTNFNLGDFKLSDLYTGTYIDFDLPQLYSYSINSGVYVQSVSFNFCVKMLSGESDVMTLYYDYLRAHPEITAHIPFYIYFESDGSTTAAKSAFKFTRALATDSQTMARSFLQELLIPNEDQVTSLFAQYVHDFESDSVGSWVISFKNLVFNLMYEDGSDAVIRMPAINIPMGSLGTIHIFDGYTFTFSDFWHHNLALWRGLRLANNFLITFAFCNSVISMVVAVFDIKWWDGVNA